MKSKLNLIGIFIFLFAAMTSCKDDIESVVNCLGETTSFKFDHEVSASDPKKVTLTVTYNGEMTLDNNIVWEFGDGNSQSATGTTIEHSYSAAGTYQAIAKVTIRKGKEFCSYDLPETIVIQ